ncbi:GntR family transcriptional regulator [Cytophagaceae bacterium YF14B1]|uniref:GntR family transcriptional regulator n=1 Tax=Xanthocytophaga flava TaxID=3048013 RepID=A0AAE3U936_9BACT|nr:GntR family transcriptional regulator [Xanthocytophaga flavus]MDJ1483287.1 GntR family transcriptional regulator [Xanthocytophaga flavus]
MEFREQQAIYVQIADYICENILLKKWLPNDRILSIRELAVELQVNPNTVTRAYDFLQSRDIIQNKRGIGYFVNEDAEQAILIYRKEQFVQHELPVLFRNMYLLNIEVEELEVQFEKYKEENFKK